VTRFQLCLNAVALSAWLIVIGWMALSAGLRYAANGDPFQPMAKQHCLACGQWDDWDNFRCPRCGYSPLDKYESIRERAR
jgi:hypothetical protein